MLFKTLGLLDLGAFLALLFGLDSFLTVFGIYLALKGLAFVLMSKDLASLIDVASGAYMMLVAAGLSLGIANTAFLIYLGQKSIFTLIRISVEAFSFVRIVKEYSKHKKPNPDYYLIR